MSAATNRRTIDDRELARMADDRPNLFERLARSWQDKEGKPA